MKKTYDVIVVGAGISGLACSRKLISAGAKILLIEANSRVGGRIYTRHETNLNFPIELGAEFVHGAPQSILNELESAGKIFYDVRDTHLYVTQQIKKPVEFWERLETIQKKLSSTRKIDRSVQDFVAGLKSIDSKSREMFLAFMEGFQAADPKLLSEKIMALSFKEGEDNLNADKMFRVLGGYNILLHLYLTDIQKEPSILQLNTIVRKIEWSRSKVKVDCESAPGGTPVSYHAKKIVVTLPMGVLKSNPASKSHIHWDPMPKDLSRMLDGFEMGHVERIAFLFRSRFWEEHLEKPLSFIHAGPDYLFPTWWSQSPMRAPLLIAWQGGPKAYALSQKPIEQRVNIAIETLGKMLKIPKARIHEQLLRWYGNDWSNNVYSRGAYSYISVGGLNAWKKFSHPFDQTIYFSGEAYASHANRGTVHGALDSGNKTAENILKERGLR